MIVPLLIFLFLVTLCLSLLVSAKTITLIKSDVFIASAHKSKGKSMSYITFTAWSKVKLFFNLAKNAYFLPELYISDSDVINSKLRDIALGSLVAEVVVVHTRRDDSSVD